MTSREVHSFTDPLPGEVLVAVWTRGHDAMDGGIRFLTHGKGTHAAFIRSNGKIAENFWPCVRERDWKPAERTTVEEYRMAGSTPEDWQKLEKWIDSELKLPMPPIWLCVMASIPIVRTTIRKLTRKYRAIYSVADLFRFALNLAPVKGTSCFCDMWCLRGIRLNLPACKQPLVRLEHPDWASPRDLRISPLLIKRQKARI